MACLKENYLALMIGNSRLHWAWFTGETLQHAWHTHHLSLTPVDPLIPPHVPQQDSSNRLFPLYIASVVPPQTQLWQTDPRARVLTLNHLPLSGLYPTLGIDRALALLGAGETYGYPLLVIDGGTALTFTGADRHRHFKGGAILPGLTLQLQSLRQNTAALPTIELPSQLPPRWAKQTATAIESGIIYTVLAGIHDFIQDWCCLFPDSPIVFTGGDATRLVSYLHSQYPEPITAWIVDPYLIFWGMRWVIQNSSFN